MIDFDRDLRRKKPRKTENVFTDKQEMLHEVPGIFVEMQQNVLAHARRHMVDYARCVKDKAIATASVDADAPDAWEQTVDQATMWAIEYGRTLHLSTQMRGLELQPFDLNVLGAYGEKES